MRFWWRNDPPLWSYALWPMTLAWRAGTAVHRAGARSTRARAPVISVGNLVAGGAGKTPVTLLLARKLMDRGRHVAVLTRGYGRKSGAPMVVEPGSRSVECGDEPLLLARRGVKVFVGPHRAELGELAVSAGADVLLLDDGLQHHALERDLDVIVADASNPLGNGKLLPMGPLRELPAALGRVRRGLIWLTHCDRPRHPRVVELARFPQIESAWRAQADLRGKRVFAFAGIARPEHFLATLLELGAEIAGTRWFRDHHPFTPGELSALRRAAGDALLVTTEKDLVRIDAPQGIVAVPIEVEILRGEEALEQALREIL